MPVLKGQYSHNNHTRADTIMQIIQRHKLTHNNVTD